MVQVKSRLSNILSNIDDDNIGDRLGPVKTVKKCKSPVITTRLRTLEEQYGLSRKRKVGAEGGI